MGGEKNEGAQQGRKENESLDRKKISGSGKKLLWGGGFHYLPEEKPTHLAMLVGTTAAIGQTALRGVVHVGKGIGAAKSGES